MTGKMIRLGAGAGYWGAELEAPLKLAEEGNLDYLCFDQLAELTMSLLERQRIKDPSRGFIPDLPSQIEAFLPVIHETGVKIITNGGGTNCAAAVEKVIEIAREKKHTGLKIAAVGGDDVSGKIDPLVAEGWKFINLDTGEEDIGAISDRIVSAYAYTGADGIVDALEREADVVIAGRVSDNALYVGPMMKEFGWSYSDDIDNIGAAITIGHLIECAELVCGGMSNLWRAVPDPWNIGFPIAECHADSSAVITKLPGTGGLVNSWTLKEHLVYEVHDPHNYIMPDGIADLTSLKLEDLGDDRVRVTKCSGKPRPDTLKVQIGYRDGYVAEALYLIGAPEALAKTDHSIKLFRNLLKRSGIEPVDIRFDRIGIDSISGDMFPSPAEEEVREVGLRIAVRTKTREEAVAARAHMLRVTLYGAVGLGWGAPAAVRPVISLWPTLIPRDSVDISVEVKEVG